MACLWYYFKKSIVTFGHVTDFLEHSSINFNTFKLHLGFRRPYTTFKALIRSIKYFFSLIQNVNRGYVVYWWKIYCIRDLKVMFSTYSTTPSPREDHTILNFLERCIRAVTLIFEIVGTNATSRAWRTYSEDALRRCFLYDQPSSFLNWNLFAMQLRCVLAENVSRRNSYKMSE